MWPFSMNRKDNKESNEIAALISERDLRNLTDNSAVLRFWLPEAGRGALEQTIKGLGMVAAKYLREFFVVHLYGAHELLKMRTMKEGLYYIPPLENQTDTEEEGSGGDIKFSRTPSVEYIPGLGMNIFPFKVFLPQRIKDDLQDLADKVGVPLSQFVREILISHFSGKPFGLKNLNHCRKIMRRLGENGKRENGSRW